MYEPNKYRTFTQETAVCVPCENKSQRWLCCSYNVVWYVKLHKVRNLLKSVAYDCNPIHFCQIQRVSLQGLLAFCSVCVLKKKSGVHTQPCLCKRETNRVTQVEPPTQVIKYQCFSRVYTKHFCIVRHSLCLYAGQTNAVRYSSLKEHWRERCSMNYHLHAKVDFGECTARYLKCKSRVICTHIENTRLTNHTVLSASWYATPVRWMDYLGKGEVLTNTDLNKFVKKIWEKYTYCVRRKSLRFFYFNSWKMGARTKVLHLYFVQCTLNLILN